MGLAVELYFDARTEDTVNALREEIRVAGIGPSRLLTAGRPHLSLAVVETEDADRLGELVSEFAAGNESCHVKLASLASFSSDKGVLFLAPVPTIELLELHARFYDCLAAAGFECDPLYLPGSWVPHCTLEMGLSGSQLASAFDSCWRAFTPTAGELTSAGVVSYPPPVPHSITPFKSPQEA